MRTQELLSQYNAKLLTTLNTIENEQYSFLKNTLDKIRKLYDDVVKTINSQAVAGLVAGVLGGICLIGAGFADAARPVVKAVAEAFGRLFPQVGQSVTTWLQGKQVKQKSEAELAQNYSLQQERAARDKTAELRQRTEQSIEELARTEHDSFRR
jgi:hypothetical protein